ncbi:MAG TPA: IPTL-CTERM sorting domain-containing protein [Thermoanaerobaculia bacterium]|jgi:DNA-binding beta-propeller fold protein YncE|nr:IPTL-CTERM sorting domain-containing protein [Thermoanaerobaculia bacterium]
MKCFSAIALFSLCFGFAGAVLADEIVANPSNISEKVSSFPFVSSFTDGAADPAAPIRTLTGPAMQMAVPRYVAADLVHGELYVANYSPSSEDAVLVYALSANGDIAPLRVISGANADLGFVYGMAVDAVHDEIFVVDWSDFAVKVFSRTANGNVAPIRTISLMVRPLAVFLDLAHDELFVSAADHIVVFDRLANGAASPIRDLTGAATQLSDTRGIFVDLEHDELLVADVHFPSPDAVRVFSRTATGNTAPLHSIVGASTGLEIPEGLTLTQSGEILVANSGESSRYAAFPRTANGDVAPSRVVSIAGGSSGIDLPIGITSTLAAGGASAFVAGGAPAAAAAVPTLGTWGFAAFALLLAGFAVARLRAKRSLAAVLFSLCLGSAGPLLADEIVTNGGNPISVASFADGASDPAAPIRTISGPNTQLLVPLYVAADLVHGELYVTNFSSNVDDAFNVYALSANGDSPLLRTVGGSNAGLDHPSGIAVDTVHDEIFVADTFGQAVKVFSRTANGNVAPIRTIAGPATGFGQPLAVFLDLAHDELFVSIGPHVLVFNRLANGDVSPIRDLAGAATLLGSGRGIFVDLEHDELLVADIHAPFGFDAVRVFSRTATGNTAPLRSIEGASTALDHPEGLTLTQSGEILVANADIPGSYVAFLRTASGDVSPSRVVSTAGGSSTINGPLAITSTLAAGGASAFVAGAPAAAAVPTLGTWGFAAFALLLAGFAVVRLRAAG